MLIFNYLIYFFTLKKLVCKVRKIYDFTKTFCEKIATFMK